MRTAMVRSIPTSALLLLAVVTSAHATVITDGDFASGTWTASRHGPAGAFSVTVNSSGGNPGAYAFMSVQSANHSDNIYVAYVKQDYVNTGALSGQSFTMSIDRSALGGNGFLATGLAVQQGSSLWYYSGGEIGANFSTTWLNGSITGTFNPGNFTLLTGSGSPSFLAGVSSKFGFYGHANNPIGTYTMSYDNWSLNSTGLTAVPEPSTLAIGGLVVLVAGMATLRGRSRRMRPR